MMISIQKIMFLVIGIMMSFTIHSNVYAFGGEGGQSFTKDCPPGQVLVGIQGTRGGYWAANNVIKTVDPICNEVDFDGTWVEQRHDSLSGTRAFNLMCQRNEYVFEVFGTYGAVVDSLGISCAALNSTGGNLVGPAGGSGPNEGIETCNAGRANGIRGRSEDVIDNINISCTTNIVPPVNMIPVTAIFNTGNETTNEEQPQPQPQPIPDVSTWNDIAAVFSHPRCANCHGRYDTTVTNGDNYRGDNTSRHHFVNAEYEEAVHGDRTNSYNCTQCHNSPWSRIKKDGSNQQITDFTQTSAGTCQSISQEVIRREWERDRFIQHFSSDDAFIVWAFNPGNNTAGNYYDDDDEGGANSIMPINTFFQRARNWWDEGMPCPSETQAQMASKRQHVLAKSPNSQPLTRQNTKLSTKNAKKKNKKRKLVIKKAKSSARPKTGKKGSGSAKISKRDIQKLKQRGIKATDSKEKIQKALQAMKAVSSVKRPTKTANKAISRRSGDKTKRKVDRISFSVDSVKPAKVKLEAGGKKQYLNLSGSNIKFIRSAKVLHKGRLLRDVDVKIQLAGRKLMLSAKSSAKTMKGLKIQVSGVGTKLELPVEIEVVAAKNKRTTTSRSKNITNSVKQKKPLTKNRTVLTAGVMGDVIVSSAAPKRLTLKRNNKSTLIRLGGKNLHKLTKAMFMKNGRSLAGLSAKIANGGRLVKVVATRTAKATKDAVLVVIHGNKKVKLPVSITIR